MRWKRRPEPSTWGDFGEDDERGRLNLLTPEVVLAAHREVKVGRVFSLSLPLDYPGGSVLSPNRRPPRLLPTCTAAGEALSNYELRRTYPSATDVVNDDRAELSLQYSTHWDSLAHVGQLFDADGDGIDEPVFYNGFRPGIDILSPDPAVDRPDGPPVRGARHLGVQAMASAGLQGRGVMIDLLRHFGRSGRPIGFGDLMQVLRADAITIETGDIVCFRTGFAELLLEMKGTPDRDVLFSTTSALDGSDARLRQWITDAGVVALVADNYAVEHLPANREPVDCCSPILPLHAHCLFRLGVVLGELWKLGELADWLNQNGRHRFLLTAPPLHLTGAVASPTTPIATV
jgi:hypothetical protein